ncbi:uracil-DNA glycosylase family protein, partial [Lacticaseibacillus rhamnosus]|uniref:uracil-DNA glycosylase family protein n=1 Tax=Lacticaseibacillus rhamnosus TaxID=47715 RepID=UPI001CDAC8F8
HFGQIRVALIIRRTIGKAYYENTFRVFHHSLNSNYYETNVIKDRLMPFIVASLQEQIKLGVDTSVCYCIGSGENFKVLTSINQTYHFFGSIVPLEHPRYVMQYHFKDRARYIQKYVAALNCK